MSDSIGLFQNDLQTKGVSKQITALSDFSIEIVVEAPA